MFNRKIKECIQTNNTSELGRLLTCDEYFDHRDEHGQSWLMRCIKWGKVECALVCLRSSYELDLINIKDTCGRRETALHIAARKGMFALICEMVKVGANPQVTDGHELPPSRVAANHGYHDIAGFLTLKWVSCPKWSSKIHTMTPIAFQREVWHCMGCKLIAWYCPRDVIALIFTALLELHRGDYFNEWFRPRSETIRMLKQ
jgi:hypothetical protein